MYSGNPTAVQNLNKNIILILLLLVISYGLFGPLALAAVVSAGTIKTIHDRRSLHVLLRKAMEAEDITALLHLDERQITLSHQQKLTMLYNAYQRQKTDFIDRLEQQEFKVSFAEIFSIFMQDKDMDLLRLFVKKFLAKTPLPSQAHLNTLLYYLLTNHQVTLIDLLFEFFPKEVIREMFSFIKSYPENRTRLLEFIASKKTWLIRNSDYVNCILTTPMNEQLCDLLMEILPRGELKVNEAIIAEIKNQTATQPFFLKLLDYFSCKKRDDFFFHQLQDMIQQAFYTKQVDVAARLLEVEPEFLRARPFLTNSLLFQYSSDWPIAEFLIAHGADVNCASDGKGLLEIGIGGRFTPVRKKQEFLDFYVRHGVDLSCELKEKPRKITSMTLLGYLPFLNLDIKGNQDLAAIRLQKYMALFLEISGTSLSNGTVCKHTYMQDSHAYWNFLLNLYFNRLNNTALLANQPLSVDEFHTCLERLYTEEGDFDAKSAYNNYKLSKPIILPAYLTDGWGAAHIATVGFMRISQDCHLIVEADRGLGRHDFSVFVGPITDYDKFRKFTATCYSPLYLEDWQYHRSQAAFQKNLSAQKDDFCPAISAKYALFMAHFLCVVKQQIAATPVAEPHFSREQLREILESSYKITNDWFCQFCTATKESMLQDYRSLDPKFIDSDFLALAEKAAPFVSDEEKELSTESSLTMTLS